MSRIPSAGEPATHPEYGAVTIVRVYEVNGRWRASWRGRPGTSGICDLADLMVPA